MLFITLHFSLVIYTYTHSIIHCNLNKVTFTYIYGPNLYVVANVRSCVVQSWYIKDGTVMQLAERMECPSRSTG